MSEKKEIVFQVRFDKVTWQALSEMSEKDYRTRANVVRLLVRDAAQKRGYLPVDPSVLSPQRAGGMTHDGL